MQPPPAELTTPLLRPMAQPPPPNEAPPLASESPAVSRMLRWLGPWSVYALITVIPLAFIIVIYGVIPVGDPESTHFREQAVRSAELALASPLPHRRRRCCCS